MAGPVSGRRRGLSRLSDRIDAGGIIASIALIANSAAIVPVGARFMFAEAIGAGGRGSIVNNSSGGTDYHSAGGAAGEDAIFDVVAGEELTATMRRLREGLSSSPPPTVLSRRGVTLLIAASAIDKAPNSSFTGAPGIGKYNGAPGSGRTTTDTGQFAGKGGGRLATSPRSDITNITAFGAGSIGTVNENYGAPLIMLTFSSTRSACVAFANALYGGNWKP